MIKKSLQITFLFLLPLYGYSSDYELTVKVANGAQNGWNLYKQGMFVSEYDGGKYTNPDTRKKGYEFWSNGIYAKYDRDSNGHHETLFSIEKEDLVYVGTINFKATFIDVSNKYKNLLHKQMRAFKNK